MRTTCFLSLPPLTSNQPQPQPAKPPQAQVSSVNKETCWKRQCLVMGVGVASYCTIIIGLEMCHSVTLEPIHITMPIANYSFPDAKWSNKRACPPWQPNSLETIVPENLPRPSARRRYQAARSSSITTPPPPLSAPSKLLPPNTPSCFSM